MDMAGHDAISIYFKPFELLAMLPAVNHDVLVFVPDEKVDPVYNSKTYKVKLVLIVKFVFVAHCKIKIRFRTLAIKKYIDL